MARVGGRVTLWPGLSPAIVDSMAKPKLWGYAEVADRAGITLKMTRTYLARARKNRRDGNPRPGDMPEPDVTISTSPAWEPETIERWLKNRPGQGAGGGAKPRKA